MAHKKNYNNTSGIRFKAESMEAGREEDHGRPGLTQLKKTVKGEMCHDDRIQTLVILLLH